MAHKGKAVITLLKAEEIFSPKAGIPPSPARAASKASSPAAQTREDKVVEEPAQQGKEADELAAKELSVAEATEEKPIHAQEETQEPLVAEAIEEDNILEELSVAEAT